MPHLPCIELETPQLSSSASLGDSRPAAASTGSTRSTISASVIWLHGLGADGNDFVPVVPELRLPDTLAVRFVFPNAPSIPVTINNGFVMPAWYDILEMNIGRRVDADQLIRSADAVKDLIQREIERGIDSERIILAGFSQGGAVIYHAALTSDVPLAGALALSTYFATADLVEPSAANRALPIRICHGKHDPVISEALGRESQQKLQALGYEPEFTSYPMEHTLSMEEIADISAWIQRVLA